MQYVGLRYAKDWSDYPEAQLENPARPTGRDHACLTQRAPCVWHRPSPDVSVRHALIRGGQANLRWLGLAGLFPGMAGLGTTNEVQRVGRVGRVPRGTGVRPALHPYLYRRAGLHLLRQ